MHKKREKNKYSKGNWALKQIRQKSAALFKYGPFNYLWSCLSPWFVFDCQKHTYLHTHTSLSQTHSLYLWKWAILEFILTEVHWRLYFIKCIRRFGPALHERFVWMPMYVTSSFLTRLSYFFCLLVCCTIIGKHSRLHVLNGCSESLKPMYLRDSTNIE